jgi:hypothetical protein
MKDEGMPLFIQLKIQIFIISLFSESFAKGIITFQVIRI